MLTRRRLWCFALGQGSGKKVHTSSSEPGANIVAKARAASTSATRMFSSPWCAIWETICAAPGCHTSMATWSISGWARAWAHTASPEPAPISTTSGARRPNSASASKR